MAVFSMFYAFFSLLFLPFYENHSLMQEKGRLVFDFTVKATEKGLFLEAVQLNDFRAYIETDSRNSEQILKLVKPMLDLYCGLNNMSLDRYALRMEDPNATVDEGQTFRCFAIPKIL